MPNEMVTMTHPKIDSDPATTTRKAYEGVWKNKGWKLEGAVSSDEPADDYDDKTNDELRAELKDRDLATTGSKDDLIARLRADDLEGGS